MDEIGSEAASEMEVAYQDAVHAVIDTVHKLKQ